MKNTKNTYFYTLQSLLMTAGCKEKYVTHYILRATGYLVAEGSVNNENDSTDFVLSRATPLNNNSIQYERGATATIEATDNSIYTLHEKDAGHYGITAFNPSTSVEYKLHMRTKSGEGGKSLHSGPDKIFVRYV